MTSNVDIHSRWVTALRTQAKTADAPHTDALPCPYCGHSGRIFQSVDQLFSHTKVEHASLLEALDPESARALLLEGFVMGLWEGAAEPQAIADAARAALRKVVA